MKFYYEVIFDPKPHPEETIYTCEVILVFRAKLLKLNKVKFSTWIMYFNNI